MRPRVGTSFRSKKTGYDIRSQTKRWDLPRSFCFLQLFLCLHAPEMELRDICSSTRSEPIVQEAAPRLHLNRVYSDAAEYRNTENQKRRPMHIAHRLPLLYRGKLCFSLPVSSLISAISSCSAEGRDVCARYRRLPAGSPSSWSAARVFIAADLFDGGNR